MATLKVMYEGNVQAEHPLPQGRTLTIGRKDSNDVIIENLIVSGTHAKVDSMEEGFLLTDLRSKNGTFVNETPVASHWLQDGDVIRIGKHTLEFRVDEEEVFALEIDDDMEQTMVFNTGEFRPTAPKQQAPAMLSYLKGGQGEVPLTKKLTKIGKDFSNDIVVSGFTVGQTSATISKLPEGYYLSYVGGMSKPKVNGRSVTESIKLEEFDVVDIGSSRFKFVLK